MHDPPRLRVHDFHAVTCVVLAKIEEIRRACLPVQVALPRDAMVCRLAERQGGHRRAAPVKHLVRGEHAAVLARSTIGEGGDNDFAPVLGGNGTKVAPTGDIFDQPHGQMRRVRGKLADLVGDHAVSSPEGTILVTSPETKSSYPRPPQSLNPSIRRGRGAVEPF